MQIRRPRKKRATINITSLIDVMFLLLIFYMVSSTFKEQPGMKLELPKSQMYERTEIKDLVLQISKPTEDTEELLLNSQPVPIDSLKSMLKRMLAQTTEKSLTIKADKRVQHGLIVQVMDIAKQSGFEKLVIATRISQE